MPNKDIIYVLTKAFKHDFPSWKIEVAENPYEGEPFVYFGGYSLTKVPEGFLLEGSATSGGSYWEPPDVNIFEISIEKDIYAVVKKSF